MFESRLEFPTKFPEKSPLNGKAICLKFFEVLHEPIKYSSLSDTGDVLNKNGLKLLSMYFLIAGTSSIVRV